MTDMTWAEFFAYLCDPGGPNFEAWRSQYLARRQNHGLPMPGPKEPPLQLYRIYADALQIRLAMGKYPDWLVAVGDRGPGCHLASTIE